MFSMLEGFAAIKAFVEVGPISPCDLQMNRSRERRRGDVKTRWRLSFKSSHKYSISYKVLLTKTIRSSIVSLATCD